MPETGKTTDKQKPAVAEELKQSIGALVDGLIAKDDEVYESEFVHLLTRVRDLVDRKLRMEGTKTDTRDFLGELMFTRLRRGMHLFLRSEDEVTALRAAEWVMGILFSVTTLSEFAKAFDQSLIRAHSGAKDFNFAGRTDFISVEEVMQMLSSGKHLGCLSLEKGDNRLDIYLKDGRVYFLDPHHMIRRVLPGDSMRHREIPETVITEAESRRARDGVPVLVTLHEKGLFKVDELRETMRMFGKEVLFDFMRESEPYAFYYRKLERLPEFADGYDLRLGVTSILLEGSKTLDDWKQMLQVFPDPDAPLEPKADMFARMGDKALGVLEIKLLSQINGDTTPRGLTASLGLPLFDVYQLLIRLSREGILAAGGGMEAIEGLLVGSDEPSTQETMQEAFAALDANDDAEQRRSAIDRVFGDSGDGSTLNALDRVLGGGPAKPAAGGAGGGDLDRELLDILRKGNKG
ncbi:MAG: DUF4388 domain-containing protein [Planctomycetes bacterium]|nr:DUF4388 domain-containing protein [Planctomycetota bacterium]MCC7399101.1 DUF4388 domain-containing protein [Planctomycetota bacterium]